MKQEIDNNAMWAAFRQELALQGELHVIAAIDNALNNLGFTIKETSTIIPIPLEQGEHANFRNKIQIGDKVTRNENGVLVNLSQLKRIAKPAENKGKHGMGISEATKQKLEDNLNKALEKETPESYNEFLDEQGEQKIPKFKAGDFIQYNGLGHNKYTIKEVCGVSHYINTDGGRMDMSYTDENFELVEQNPTDKVEPKFKVGDWVVNTITKEVEQVIELTNDEYICSGHLIVSFNNQHLLRKWTIQDAKDGDVLCYKDEISLYKHDIKNCTKEETTFGGFVYYCCYDGKRFIMDSLYSLMEQDKMDIHPATKEQRDLLFQKMKEAGYEWDAEKKELRKIESDEWSDECCINQLIVFCENCMVQDTNAKRCANFLKSLKDRYTWKPSDKQMKAIEHICDGNYNVDLDILDSIYRDFKKLKG